MITTLNLAIIGLSIVGWVVVSAPEPCPKKYLDMGGDVIKYCEITPAGLGKQWSLKEE